jgi:hypothetical protein
VVYNSKVESGTRRVLGFDNQTDELSILRICQDMVRADFNQMGSLINNGLIPERPFLEQYYNTILISWKAL